MTGVAVIRHPRSEPPDPGTAVEIAPGILWIRLPLPLRLNHVNVYALEDGDGWTIVDAGYGDAATLAAWQVLLDGPLAGRGVQRLIVTHHHPDHVGAAGWLLRATGARLVMSRSEFLMAYLRCHGLPPEAIAAEEAFFRPHGVSPAVLAAIGKRDALFQQASTPLPLGVEVVSEGDVLRIGGRDWRVLTGKGHSFEQLMLYCPDDALFLSADQIIDRITPNIPASYVEPAADPVTDFLETLSSLRGVVAAESLVLSGHRLPFLGIRARIDELIHHHRAMFDAICVACAEAPMRAADLVPIIYRRDLGPHGEALAVSEILAHVAALVATGDLRAEKVAERDVLLRATTHLGRRAAAGSPAR